MALLDFMPLFVPISFSFSCNWYHARSNGAINFTKTSVLDDIFTKLDMNVAQARARHEFLPEMFTSPQAKPSASLGIGLATIPHFLYGAPVMFRPNQDPWSDTLLEAGEDPVARIPALDDAELEARFRPLAIIKDRVYERYSKTEVSLGPPDLQGPMNLLFRLCGERIYGYMLKKKDIAHRLFENITRTFINAHRYFRGLLHGTREKSRFSVAECCSFLESPALVDEFNRKYDNQCAKELGPMNLHSCGESTRNLDVFARFDIVSAEFGFGTDLTKARCLLIAPGMGPVPFSCRLEPKRLLSLTREQVMKDVEFILDRVKGGPASICSVGVDAGTPRENLLAAMARVDQYHKEKEEDT